MVPAGSPAPDVTKPASVWVGAAQTKRAVAGRPAMGAGTSIIAPARVPAVPP